MAVVPTLPSVDDTLRGAAWCRARTATVDAFLAELLAPHASPGMALVALGGYGRSELCPGSDIDVMLLHDGRGSVRTVADQVWYPLWDAGLHLGHSVSTVGQALKQARNDLDTATALLTARHVAGDPGASAALGAAARTAWRKDGSRWLDVLGERALSSRGPEVAFALEPDLKSGTGGLRDVHGLWWAEMAAPVLYPGDAEAVGIAYAVILAARVELQRLSGRPSNILALEYQAEVAAALGYGEPDDLMAAIASAAGTIAWTADDAWRRLVASPDGGRRARRTRRPAHIPTIASTHTDSSGPLAPWAHPLQGALALADTAPWDDPFLPLRAAAMAAWAGLTLERDGLERLAAAHQSSGAPADPPALPAVWPEAGRHALVHLLLAGPPAVRVIEALDRRGLWDRYLPEWASIRARRQDATYHRFTVDRHLLEAAARAARLATRVVRPDLLVLAALLHDIGKGGPEDHSAAGESLTRRILLRLGYPPEDAETAAFLVRHHLVLPTLATSRDLDDPETVLHAAELIGDAGRLALLAALAEADGLATGPAGWTAWKAALVYQLVERIDHALAGTAPGAGRTFPTASHLARLEAGGEQVSVDEASGLVTVITADRQGVFSRVAGVLTLHGLDVLAAAAYSNDAGRALSEFQTADRRRDETPWSAVRRDIELALSGRLAVRARVAARARAYARGDTSGPSAPATAIHFDNEASADATVIDVHTADGIGVLYAITRSLAELDLDIRLAKVDTLGRQIRDAFYVRDGTGAKITDVAHLTEIERALRHALERTEHL